MEPKGGESLSTPILKNYVTFGEKKMVLNNIGVILSNFELLSKKVLKIEAILSDWFCL